MTGSVDMLFSIHVLATLYMLGLIWFVQLVHYPLFGRIGSEDFVGYEAEHVTRTSRAVVLPMILELASGCTLAFRRPPQIEGFEATIGLVLIGAIWGSTFLLQVPAHRKLAKGFDRGVAALLVSTNWIRTLGWTARAALCVVWIARLG
jgi:hypothetical protein